MIATLRPCTACHRHVRYSDDTCPFCSAELPRETPARLPDVSRLSRAAQIALGALMMAGCGADPNTGPVAPAPPQEDAGAGQSSGDMVAMYGAPAAPPPTSSTQQPTPPVDPGPSDPGPARPMYGMPPPK